MYRIKKELIKVSLFTNKHIKSNNQVKFCKTLKHRDMLNNVFGRRFM
jgi:hypothetical protein